MRHYSQDRLITLADFMRVPWVRRVEEDREQFTVVVVVPWYCPRVGKVREYIRWRAASGLGLRIRREFP